MPHQGLWFGPHSSEAGSFLTRVRTENGEHSDFGTIFRRQAIIEGLPRAMLCVKFSFTTAI